MALFRSGGSHAVIDAGMGVTWFSPESWTATLSRAKVDASCPAVVVGI
jgi:hypothetical protein